MKLVLTFGILMTAICAGGSSLDNDNTPWWQRWYRSYMKQTSPSSVLFSSRTRVRDAGSWMLTCSQRCFQMSDCIPGLSCFHATAVHRGCCLPPLKPNVTDCSIDEQCRIACESTYCDRSVRPSRCLCNAGTSYLFGKCWNRCPDFAYPQPLIDYNGFSRCVVKTDMATALRYMRRYKRQNGESRMFC